MKFSSMFYNGYIFLGNYSNETSPPFLCTLFFAFNRIIYGTRARINNKKQWKRQNKNCCFAFGHLIMKILLKNFPYFFMRKKKILISACYKTSEIIFLTIKSEWNRTVLVFINVLVKILVENFKIFNIIQTRLL